MTRMLVSVIAIFMALGVNLAWAAGPDLPTGWTFHCEGSTGVYKGPNGSTMEWPNSRHCAQSPESGPI